MVVRWLVHVDVVGTRHRIQSLEYSNFNSLACGVDHHTSLDSNSAHAHVLFIFVFCSPRRFPDLAFFLSLHSSNVVVGHKSRETMFLAWRVIRIFFYSFDDLVYLVQSMLSVAGAHLHAIFAGFLFSVFTTQRYTSLDVIVFTKWMFTPRSALLKVGSCIMSAIITDVFKVDMLRQFLVVVCILGCDLDGDILFCWFAYFSCVSGTNGFSVGNMIRRRHP